MAGSNDICEREKIVKEIEKTSESIRKKYRALKTGKIEDDIAVKRHLGPIIEPLQKIVDSSSVHTIKNEPVSHDDDVKIDTLPAQKREKDVISSETKRKRTLPDRSLIESPESPKRHRLDDDDEVLITSTPRAMIGDVQPTNNILATGDVFETTDDSLATVVQDRIQTVEGQKALRGHLGPLGQKYIGAVLRGEKGIDNVYGVYLGRDGMMLGSKRFDVDNSDNIIVDGMRYIGTPGLYELIFKKIPDDDEYTEDDMQKYKNILLTTNAYRRNHSEHGQLRGNRGHKYKYVIAPLLQIESGKKKSGRGLPHAMTLNDNAIDYVHWDDPNELVDRLRLLEASRQAGHNAHDNEMLSIIEELREAGLIIN